ncbi:TRAP transporter small permease [Rhizobium sp. SSA_523]|uniref:TRAP transporter small permease n=1 Tax=Rhizobium sp. SSA_523 TaxID=2952477 RepID=UPI0020912954|nr:TRAP transporter small permease [Rhizobium sp. SSA_523]MCO5730998.1 TRAP transporter small permease [Rhizobium sp. SSA_523]WKC24197.1 TRAP transporter small permease [Rhizobium sp. SSA_523]
MATHRFTGLDRFGRLTEAMATGLVALGGLCLVGASVLTGFSIFGSFALRPIPGEIEIVEALCGLAVFAFLPFCQLKRGHVGVDMLIEAFGRKAMNITQLAGDVIIALLIGLLSWRHAIGLMDKFGNGETTPLLLLPIWWGYAIAMVLLIANLVTCLYVILADLRDLRDGRAIATSVGAH